LFLSLKSVAGDVYNQPPMNLVGGVFLMCHFRFGFFHWFNLFMCMITFDQQHTRGTIIIFFTDNRTYNRRYLFVC